MSRAYSHGRNEQMQRHTHHCNYNHTVYITGTIDLYDDDSSACAMQIPQKKKKKKKKKVDTFNHRDILAMFSRYNINVHNVHTLHSEEWTVWATQ